MIEIPEDILIRARKIVGKPNEAMSAQGTGKMVLIVAKALLAERLAERDRCAKIAQSGDINDFGYGYIETESDMRDAISEAIRR